MILNCYVALLVVFSSSFRMTIPRLLDFLFVNFLRTCVFDMLYLSEGLSAENQGVFWNLMCFGGILGSRSIHFILVLDTVVWWLLILLLIQVELKKT